MYACRLSFSIHEYCAQFCFRSVRGLFGCIIASRASEIGHICTYRPTDGGSFHVFLANVTMILYVTELTSSSVVLFVHAIFMNSVVYCSCSSLGMRSRIGLDALTASNIQSLKLINTRISYQMAILILEVAVFYSKGV